MSRHSKRGKIKSHGGKKKHGKRRHHRQQEATFIIEIERAIGIEVISRNGQVIVASVDEESPCFEVIKTRDVITSVDEEPVQTDEQWEEAVRKWRQKNLRQLKLVIKQDKPRAKIEKERKPTQQKPEGGSIDIDFEFSGPSSPAYCDRFIKPLKSSDYSAYCQKDLNETKRGNPLAGVKLPGAADVIKIIQSSNKDILRDFSSYSESGHIDNSKKSYKKSADLSTKSLSIFSNRSTGSKTDNRDCSTTKSDASIEGKYRDSVKIAEILADNEVNRNGVELSILLDISAFLDIFKQREIDINLEDTQATALLEKLYSEKLINSSTSGAGSKAKFAPSGTNFETNVLMDQRFSISKDAAGKVVGVISADNNRLIDKNDQQFSVLATNIGSSKGYDEEPESENGKSSEHNVEIDKSVVRMNIASDVSTNKILRKPKPREQ